MKWKLEETCVSFRPGSPENVCVPFVTNGSQYVELPDDITMNDKSLPLSHEKPPLSEEQQHNRL